jgi:hypothetical protein
MTQKNLERINLSDLNLDTMDEHRFQLEKGSWYRSYVKAKVADLLRVYLCNNVVNANFFKLVGM